MTVFRSVHLPGNFTISLFYRWHRIMHLCINASHFGILFINYSYNVLSSFTNSEVSVYADLLLLLGTTVGMYGGDWFILWFLRNKKRQTGAMVPISTLKTYPSDLPSFVRPWLLSVPSPPHSTMDWDPSLFLHVLPWEKNHGLLISGYHQLSICRYASVLVFYRLP